MIHGSRVSIGCLAMTDSKIEEIYTLCDAALQNGQPYFRVHVFPFALSEEKIARMKNTRTMAKWRGFWEELKPGYDQFEKTRIPPNVSVKNGKYVFE